MNGPARQLLAHGLGGSTDLPIPFSYTVVAAAWALSISFVILVFAWRTPRLRADSVGRRVPQWINTVVTSAAFRNAMAALGLAFTGWVALAGFLGPRSASHNALPGTFYVLLWVGVVALSVLFGPVWKLISPARAVRRLLDRGKRFEVRRSSATYPERFGYWLAVIGLFGFAWVELVSPDPGSVTAIIAWCVVYLVVTVGGAIRYGATWCERADPFEVYSTLVSRISFVGPGNRPGIYVLRLPLNNLQATKIRAGSVALAATLLGSTAFDSFSAQAAWHRFVDSASARLAPIDATVASTAVRSVGLIMMIVLVGGTFWLAAQAVPALSRAERRKLPGLLSPSLTPIIVGYVFAHYLSYLVEKGQSTIQLLFDPFDRGWNVFGLKDHGVAYILSAHPALLATIKVTCVLTGHILGVMAAHDRSLRLLPQRQQLSGQLALLLTMVFYTCGGLYLLFQA
ncbi:hypothetical protein TUM20983_40270 [Mycobacterium antarcticum]|uniref:hypothetical protein n=1 Tax=unclassified Mycolicibacterium TaxID=2636767 RepID=UPI00239719CF|nr:MULTISPECIES: hypothetical protein [unclassified Mycolicibacterium]GLP76917.1 hypothetical protein TUM20983_40270 [Mycolicibacterium sp. TUM20983]GLP82662.1 hypothetical protein TUM20984_40820 [Mycolicibacterium sp. TUM20984]